MKSYKRFLLRKNNMIYFLLATWMAVLFALIAKAIGFDRFNDTAKNAPYTLVYFAPFSKTANVGFVFAW